MNLPSVSVIFTNYNGGNNPIDCIKSIKKLNYPQKKIEIIVVDNNSKDKSAAVIKTRFPSVKILPQTRNLGFAKGSNVGIKKASGEYIFVTNDDILFEKNSLKKLISYAQSSKTLGIFGGKQLNPKTKKFLAGGRNFSLWTASQRFVKSTGNAVSCDQIDGCTMLISKDLIKKIGYFDEGFYPAYFEDLDLCLRAKKQGFPVIYVPSAIFMHKYAQTISKLKKEKVYFIGFKNKLRLIIKHSTIVQLLTFIFTHYFITMPARLVIKREPILVPEIRAIIWNIKHLKSTLATRSGTL